MLTYNLIKLGRTPNIKRVLLICDRRSGILCLMDITSQVLDICIFVNIFYLNMVKIELQLNGLNA